MAKRSSGGRRAGDSLVAEAIATRAGGWSQSDRPGRASRALQTGRWRAWGCCAARPISRCCFHRSCLQPGGSRLAIRRDGRSSSTAVVTDMRRRLIGRGSRHDAAHRGGGARGCRSSGGGWSCCRSPSPRHGGANPSRPAIRGTRTCIWRMDRSGPSPRGSSDTCSRRRPARRSFWVGGLPRRLRRCAGPPAGRAGGPR